MGIGIPLFLIVQSSFSLFLSSSLMVMAELIKKDIMLLLFTLFFLNKCSKFFLNLNYILGMHLKSSFLFNPCAHLEHQLWVEPSVGTESVIMNTVLTVCAHGVGWEEWEKWEFNTIQFVPGGVKITVVIIATKEIHSAINCITGSTNFHWGLSTERRLSWRSDL